MRKLIITLIALGFGLASIVRAGSLSEHQLKEILGQDYIEWHDGDDVSYAFEFYYTGTSSNCSIDVGADDIYIRVPADGTAIRTIDTSAAAYDTIGEVVKYIDAHADLTCSIQDSDLFYDDDSSLCRYVAPTNIGGDMKYSVQIDTAGTHADCVGTDAYIAAIRVGADTDEYISLWQMAGTGATNGDDLELYVETEAGVKTKLDDVDIPTNGTVVTETYVFEGVGGVDLAAGDDLIVKLNGTAAQAAGDYLKIWYQKK